MNILLRKKIVTLTLSGILVFAVTACGNSNQGLSSDNSTSTATATLNNTKGALVVNNEQDQKEIDSKVIHKTNSEAVLKHIIKDFKDLFSYKDADAVIEGKITKIEYVKMGIDVDTILTIEVSKVVQGACSSVTTVRESGGYISQKEIEKENEDKFPNSKQSNNYADDSLVSDTFMGVPHPIIGQEIIASLNKLSEKDKVGKDADYLMLGDATGRFTINQDGSYTRKNNEKEWQKSISETNANAILKSINK